MSEPSERRGVIGKADSRYWTQPGKLVADARSRFLSCKVQVAGRRESFPLRTPNQSAAAAKAAQIFGDVVALGWEHALTKHKPETVKPDRPSTVAELLRDVKASPGLRLSTFTTYGQCLRQIVSEIAGIGDQPALDENGQQKRDRRRRAILLSRFDCRSGGRDAWAAKVDEQPLAVLTADAVQRRRPAHIARARDGPDAMRRAKNSTAGVIPLNGFVSPRFATKLGPNTRDPCFCPCSGQPVDPVRLAKRSDPRSVANMRLL